MPGACRECLGRSWIFIDDSPQPCPKCVKRMKTPAAKKTFEASALKAFEIAERIASNVPNNDSYEYVDTDHPPANAPPNSAAVGPLEVGFTQEQVDAQNARDLAAMQATGFGRKKS